jgi:hypothetical protein
MRRLRQPGDDLGIWKNAHTPPPTSSPEASPGLGLALSGNTSKKKGFSLACDGKSHADLSGTHLQIPWAAHRRSHRDKNILFHLLERKTSIPACAFYAICPDGSQPLGLPIRYDVRFFVAPAPPGQEASHDQRELTEHVWIQPRHALDRCRQGTFDMVLPTIRTLEDIAGFATVEETLARVGNRQVTPVLTKIRIRRGAYVEVMPDEGDP